MVIHSSFPWNDLEDTLVYCFWRGCGAGRLKELECFPETHWRPPLALGLGGLVPTVQLFYS